MEARICPLREMGQQRLRPVLFLLCPVLSLLLVSCGNDKKWYELNEEIWSTACHIRYAASENLNDSIHAIFDAVNNSISTYNPNSILSRYNKGNEVIGDSVMIRSFILSKLTARSTDFYYDPTVCSAVDLWGFGRKIADTTPTSNQIDSIRQLVGIELCSLKGDRITRSSSAVKLDFNAIAKGLACDMIGEMFLRNGVNNYLVEIGGEILCHGHNEDGNKWRILVEAPMKDRLMSDSYNDEISPVGIDTLSSGAIEVVSSGVIEVTDCGIATSGNYRRNRIIDGKREGHIINPKTCRPGSNGVLSATVMAPSGAVADAYATAFMHMPLDSIRLLIGCDETGSLGTILMYPDSLILLGSAREYFQ